MKKYILSILTSIAALAVFTSCEKDSEGLTGIVYYPAIALEGSSMVNWEAGVPFVDPGYSSTYMGEDYTSHVEITTDLNQSNPAPGLYSITYDVVSPDGYSASATRKVWVVDPADEINGYYRVSSSSYRISSAGTTVYGNIPYTFYVVGWGDGDYEVQDMLGGYYSVRAGYGFNYAMWGLINVADGAVKMTSSYVPGWGDASSGLEDGAWDAETGTLSWCNIYAGMYFYVTMTKVQ